MDGELEGGCCGVLWGVVGRGGVCSMFSIRSGKQLCIMARSQHSGCVEGETWHSAHI